jgi:hypothetical protein
MLTRLIVASYAWLLEVALWVALAIAAAAGYQLTVPIMSALGAILTPEIAWKFLGAFVLSAITFLILAVVTGPFLVVVDLRHAVRRIAARLERDDKVRELPPYERRDPSI